MADHAVAERASNIVWSILDGETVLLDTSSGYYFSMNPVATEIWQGLQQGDSLSHIVETIASRYGVKEERVRRDVTELIGELRAAKLWN
jgi:Coenzyme PQQ synthesis protein D (PqqD)